MRVLTIKGKHYLLTPMQLAFLEYQREHPNVDRLYWLNNIYKQKITKSAT